MNFLKFIYFLLICFGFLGALIGMGLIFLLFVTFQKFKNKIIVLMVGILGIYLMTKVLGI